MTTHDLFEDYSKHLLKFNDPSSREIWRDYETNLAQFLPSNKEDAILDLGCGLGILLTFLEHKGYTNTYGIDVSESQATFCQQHGLNQVHHVEDSQAFLESRPNTYSTIFAIDVIEHIPKPQLIPLLRAIYGALKLGGFFVMRVPNIASAVGSWTRYVDITHELSFDQRALTQALELGCFERIAILPTITAYRRRWLGFVFESVRKLLYLLLRIIYFIQSPGTKNPTIFTINIIGVGYKT